MGWFCLLKTSPTFHVLHHKQPHNCGRLVSHLSLQISEPMEKKALKKHPKRIIVLSKAIKAQALWRNRNPTIPPHINLGGGEVFYLTFTNTVTQFITQTLLKYSNRCFTPTKGVRLLLFQSEKMYKISVFFCLAHMHWLMMMCVYYKGVSTPICDMDFSHWTE